ncbi:MAG: thioesterase family protein [Bacteroidales bacterium]|nr:thioesterase family protein [Bacteroidales bacterium]
MLKIGLTHTSTTVVDNSNTARQYGSGGIDVFATPAMVGLMENAAMTAVADDLPDGSTTVGAHISTSHVKPSKLGATIKATAVLEEIDGRKLTFKVSACDDDGIIGEGSHIRYIVDIQRFMSKL